MNRKIAFIGLGVMGFPMASHLLHAGHEVCVWNRSKIKSEKWVEAYGGRMAATPGKAVDGADIVMLCVDNDETLESVLRGKDGVFYGLRPGTIVVDHTSSSADIARSLFAEGMRLGVDFLDAPVSGGQPGAVNGTLVVMVGGDEAVYERVKPVLSCYATDSAWVGPTGAGQLAKMVNQICLAGMLQGLAEGLQFGRASGLEMSAVLSLLTKGTAQSWQLDNRGKSMLDGVFSQGFAVDLMRKDLAMALDVSRQINARLPVTALVDQMYAEVQQRDGGRWDTSSLIVNLQPSKKFIDE